MDKKHFMDNQFNSGDVIEFRLIKWIPKGMDEEGKTKYITDIKKKWVTVGGEKQIPWEWFKSMCDDGYHIFYGVHPRTAEGLSGDDNVKDCRWLIADFDGIPKENLNLEYIKGIIAKANLPVATKTVFSGNGFHAYWRLMLSVSKEEWKPIQCRLIDLLKSDEKCKNAERLLRVPDFINEKIHKGLPPVMCKVVEHNPDAFYDLATFDKLLPAAKESTSTKTKHTGETPWNWDVVDVEKVISSRGVGGTKQANDIVIFCINGAAHGGGADGTESLRIAFRGDKKGVYNCVSCPQSGTLVDLMVALDGKPNTAENRQDAIDELERDYPGFNKLKRQSRQQQQQQQEHPIENILHWFNNWKRIGLDKAIADCPVCKNHTLHLEERMTPKMVIIDFGCDTKCSQVEIMMATSSWDPKLMSVKREEIHKTSDQEKAKEIFNAGGMLPLYYDKNQSLDIVNDVLDLRFAHNNLKYMYLALQEKGQFREFMQASNEWILQGNKDIRSIYMYFLNRVYQPNGKKKLGSNSAIEGSLTNMTQEHKGVLRRDDIGQAAFLLDSLPIIEGVNPDEVDGELLSPHLNGNLWIETKPPYRRVLFPSGTYHYHRSTRQWDYKSFELVNYEDGIGHFRRLTNLGVVTDEDEIGKLFSSRLQPKIYYDWFCRKDRNASPVVVEDDPGGRVLYYEEAGYWMAGKNDEKKIFYWLDTSNAGKNTAEYLITLQCGEDNIWSTKIQKMDGQFSQLGWLCRGVNFTDAKQKANASTDDTVNLAQAVAESSGNDVVCIEGKGTNQENHRLCCHIRFILNQMITLMDQDGEQINRAIIRPFEHDVVADPDIITNRNINQDLTVPIECQIFQSLALQADMERRMRGGEFSHSCFEDEHRLEFIKRGDEWVKYLSDKLVIKEFEKDRKNWTASEMRVNGIFNDELITRAMEYWELFHPGKRCPLSPKSMGRKLSSAFKKLEWKIEKRSCRKEKAKGTSDVSTIVLGIRWINPEN